MTRATTWGVPGAGPATPTENNDRNNASMDANMSQHFDPVEAARPTYLLKGATWAFDNGASPQEIEVYFFDGTDDILLYTIDVTANSATYAPPAHNDTTGKEGGVSGVFNHLGALQYATLPGTQGTSIADSAAPTVSTDGNYLLALGSTTRTSYVVAASRSWVEETVGARTYTASASIVTEDGNDIDALAGQVLMFQSKAANVVHVTKAPPVAVASTVTEVSTRTTTGTWSITGLTISKPLFIVVGGTTSQIFQFRVASGSNDAVATGSDYFTLRTDNASSGIPGSITIVPTATTVSITVNSISATTARAYQ